MPRHSVSAAGEIDADPDVVYRVIADYQRHHGNILPPAFSNLVVEEGGIGAGTRVSFDLRLGGATKHFTGVITEPEAGRRLVETYRAQKTETTFTIEPFGNGCIVTITTEFETHGGVVGMIQRWLVSRLLRPLYADELSRLDAYVARLP
jgi:uncharacterized protein YndB with AHSA1/START domain